MKIKTIGIDEKKARDAFDVHAALLKTEHRYPELRNNPAWTVLRQDAFEAFSNAFTVLA